jgi:3D (Asp-Asp-Asp) domain-containing protein
MTQPPQDRIIGYGTNIVIRTLDTPDGPLQYWRKIFVRITAYSASRSGTPTEAPWYGRTRTGKTLTKGIVAVDPTVIPLGTKLYVLGYGFGSADDTGSQIQGKWVDLGYDDWNFEHWYGYTDVYLLAPAPPPEQINWVLP